ncbi:MAG: hypothetical protein M1826_006732 [Phylliscum demangeonii]|nr:MAG: hypothetical protein M1826_006732 [Phylliscum demangeonii]
MPSGAHRNRDDCKYLVPDPPFRFSTGRPHGADESGRRNAIVDESLTAEDRSELRAMGAAANPSIGIGRGPRDQISNRPAGPRNHPLDQQRARPSRQYSSEHLCSPNGIRHARPPPPTRREIAADKEHDHVNTPVEKMVSHGHLNDIHGRLGYPPVDGARNAAWLNDDPRGRLRPRDDDMQLRREDFDPRPLPLRRRDGEAAAAAAAAQEQQRRRRERGAR